MRDQGAIRIVFDDWEEDLPTAVSSFDVAAYDRSVAVDDTEWGRGHGPGSGIRPSLPTLSGEVGALPNEPEQDALLRALGGRDRELRLRAHVAEVTRCELGPEHGYLLGMIDGMTSIGDMLDISAMPRLATLRAMMEMVLLGIVG